MYNSQAVLMRVYASRVVCGYLRLDFLVTFLVVFLVALPAFAVLS